MSVELKLVHYISYDTYSAYTENGSCIGDADTIKDAFRLYGNEDIHHIDYFLDLYVNGEYVGYMNRETVWKKGDPRQVFLLLCRSLQGKIYS